MPVYVQTARPLSPKPHLLAKLLFATRSDAQRRFRARSNPDARVLLTTFPDTLGSAWLAEHVETANGYVSISTMHLAKGLEFRAVVVMACDDEVIPLQERIETVGDDADLQEVYDTERHLLYVACTRARDQLLVTGIDPASEFLDDFLQKS